MGQQATLNSLFPWINTGTFRNQVTLLTQTIGTNAAGAVVTWAASDPPVTAWAKVKYLRGEEKLSQSQDVTQTVITLTMNYDSRFTAQSRVQLESGAQFIVQSPENVADMGVYLVLTCLGIGGADQ